jgi:hypothetical protein
VVSVRIESSRRFERALRLALRAPSRRSRRGEDATGSRCLSRRAWTAPVSTRRWDCRCPSSQCVASLLQLAPAFAAGRAQSTCQMRCRPPIGSVRRVPAPRRRFYGSLTPPGVRQGFRGRMTCTGVGGDFGRRRDRWAPDIGSGPFAPAFSLRAAMRQITRKTPRLRNRCTQPGPLYTNVAMAQPTSITTPAISPRSMSMSV